MEIILIDEKIRLAQVKEMAQNQFGNLIKATIDTERKVIALGGDLHADEEALLLENGSEQQHLWGINIYPAKYGEEGFIEFDSMINIRPRDNNFSRDVEDKVAQKKIIEIVLNLIIEK
jgi:hypothetical protein